MTQNKLVTTSTPWALLALLLMTLASCEPQKEQTQAQRQDMVVSIYASVIIEPEGLYQVYASSSGIIEGISVSAGDTVEEGEELFCIKNENKSLSLSEAQEDYSMAKDNLSGERNRLKAMEQDIELLSKRTELDSINYFRQKRLWDQGVGSRLEYENKLLQWETSRSNLTSAKTNLSQYEQDLEYNVKQTQYRLQKVRNNLSEFQVHSLMEGRVYEVFKEPGELIGPNQALAQIGHKDSFLIKMQVDEVDIADVRKNQEVIVELEAYQGKTFVAHVRDIYPSKDTKTQTFRVDAIFKETPPELFAGLSGEASIVIETKPNTLIVPVEYVSGDNTVLTKDGATPIEVGARNMSHVEVLSGIDEQTVLIKP